MALLAFVIGIGLPSIVGWLVIKLLEWKSNVLFSWERWVLGFVLGMNLTMFITFLAHIAGLIRFTLMGFLLVQIPLVALLSLCAWRLKGTGDGTMPRTAPSPPMSTPVKILLIVLGMWSTVKIISVALMLLLSPINFDDEFDNWNFRGLLYYANEEMTLEMELDGNKEVPGVSSYPPTVPLPKTWMATINGEWNHPLAKSIHIVWYLSALALVYGCLRRKVSRSWSLAGVYALSSVPLYTIHGAHAYADVFLSAHVLSAVYLLYLGLQASSSLERGTFLRLSALATALVIFTKNEAMLTHLPTILFLLAVGLAVLRKKGVMSWKEIRTVVLQFVIAIAIIAIPWILFKLAHDLPFGNAKGLPTEFAWQPGILRAIGISIFLEGNWNLLFPLLIVLILWNGKRLLKSSVIILVAYTVILIVAQMPIYLFTGLSIEALNQTAYARSLLQIAPIAVVAMILLAQSLKNTED